MPYIGNTPAEKYAAFDVQHFTTSATTGYTLTHAVANENDIRLVINNVVQQPGSSYAYTASGTTLTLSSATSGTDTMYCVFLGKAVQTVNPAAGSVGTSQLADDAVTTIKINDDAVNSAKLSSTAVDNTNTNSTLITAQTEKSSLADADKFLISDSAASGALKYVQKSNLPSGGLQLVTSFTPGSEGSTIVVDNCFTATYDRYLVFCERLRNGNSQARLDVYLRTGGSSGSDSCNLGGAYLGYRYNNQYMSGSINPNSCQGTIASNVENDRWYNAMMYFIQPYDSAYTTNIQGQSAYREGSTGNYGFINFGYQPDNTVSHTGFAIQLSAGNFNQTQSTIKVYGIVDS